MSSASPEQQRKFVLYHYEPSLPAAILFAAIFAGCGVLHARQIYQTKTWYFTAMLIGVLMEATGYFGRIISHFDNMALGPYIMQTLFILIAPALIAASIYIILGRIIVALEAERYSLVPIKWLTKIFVTGDIFSFFMQASGGGMMAGSPETMLHTGEQVIIGGLFIQLVFFGFFMITCFTFHMRIRRNPTSASLTHQASVSWQKLLLVLYTASGLIMVRSIFRLIEYMQGNDGYLLKHEAYLYIFDAVLMAGAVILFNVYHPSKVLVEQRDRKGFYDNSHNAETYMMAQGA